MTSRITCAIVTIIILHGDQITYSDRFNSHTHFAHHNFLCHMEFICWSNVDITLSRQLLNLLACPAVRGRNIWLQKFCPTNLQKLESTHSRIQNKTSANILYTILRAVEWELLYHTHDYTQIRYLGYDWPTSRTSLKALSIVWITTSSFHRVLNSTKLTTKPASCKH